MSDVLQQLYETIQQRKENPISESYTNYLFTKGEDKILKKLGEECTEVVIAAKNNEKDELIKEVVDFTYHCLVLLVEKNVSLQEIVEELNKRQGQLSRVGERKEIDTL
ncbi:phosphoribosyl-ATP diphosphatase [Bacillus sp. 3103sda1]|jgi:phosphoribosyl-ATP pyrophosphohydrolase|uniref:phosphoribosyl-ATP diphosphatase n=1 Tax=Bacillus sp. 3103sda1 TaxID=2953808 RepID=UPI00209EE850|nr:phosphoribosyl-ATP diphosphatase [Bacillus sp. 3103sda1]MCP1123072.1 phosphoribosyl-ATP diphosphatase [Bacillus sp. 3103sda1]